VPQITSLPLVNPNAASPSLSQPQVQQQQASLDSASSSNNPATTANTQSQSKNIRLANELVHL
jgi:hypothetical protein